MKRFIENTGIKGIEGLKLVESQAGIPSPSTATRPAGTD